MFDSVPEIEAFIADFEACRLPPARWTHHAHLLVGLWYLDGLPFGDALKAVRAGIRRHNESVGTPNTEDSGYHETLTRLYLTGIAAHRSRHAALALPDSLRLLLASPLSDRQWPLSYYTRQLLFSKQARRAWIEPDLRKL